MAEHRPTNSELRLSQLDEEEAARDKEHSILELFDHPKPRPDEPVCRDEDASLERDPGE